MSLDTSTDTPDTNDIADLAEDAAPGAAENTEDTASRAAPPPDPAEPQQQAFTVNDRRFWAQDDAEAEEQQRSQLPSFVEQLQQQLQDKDKQLREYIAAYKQEVVEGLAKTKERLERDAAAQLQRLRGEIAEPMLEVLEALERSLIAAESGADTQSIVQGVRMVQMLMMQKLQGLGLERVEAVGQPFDPARHEAVTVQPVSDPAQDNVVVSELRPGFTLGDRLVRPAQVQVGKYSG